MDAQPEPQCGGDYGPERRKLNQFATLTEGHMTAATLSVFDEQIVELLHELNNVFVSVLLNTQVMEWKLPSYSRLKRNLHEVQRNAQRGGELAKRLLNQLQAMSHERSLAGHNETGMGDSVAANGAVTGQEPGPAIRCELEEIEPPKWPAPVFPAPGKKVPHTPV
jgi:hypothetical protein